jgi:hypothetical protein
MGIFSATADSAYAPVAERMLNVSAHIFLIVTVL